MSGPYAAYVIGAYAIAAGGIVALVLWAALARRAARAGLSRAERTAAREAERHHEA